MELLRVFLTKGCLKRRLQCVSDPSRGDANCSSWTPPLLSVLGNPGCQEIQDTAWQLGAPTVRSNGVAASVVALSIETWISSRINRSSTQYCAAVGLKASTAQEDGAPKSPTCELSRNSSRMGLEAVKLLDFCLNENFQLYPTRQKIFHHPTPIQWPFLSSFLCPHGKIKSQRATKLTTSV